MDGNLARPTARPEPGRERGGCSAFPAVPSPAAARDPAPLSRFPAPRSWPHPRACKQRTVAAAAGSAAPSRTPRYSPRRQRLRADPAAPQRAHTACKRRRSPGAGRSPGGVRSRRTFQLQRDQTRRAALPPGPQQRGVVQLGARRGAALRGKDGKK